ALAGHYRFECERAEPERALPEALSQRIASAFLTSYRFVSTTSRFGPFCKFARPVEEITEAADLLLSGHCPVYPQPIALSCSQKKRNQFLRCQREFESKQGYCDGDASPNPLDTGRRAK